jgi:hypothetical protein
MPAGGSIRANCFALMTCMTHRTGSTRFLFVLLAASLLPCGGCKLMRVVTDAPGKLASTMTPTKPAPKIDPAQLSPRLMRYADQFALGIRQATEAFAAIAGTTEAEIQGLRWRIDYTDIVMQRATVDRAFEGLFDTILVVTAMRVRHQEHWKGIWGEADEPILTALNELESDLWNLAADGMTPEQLADTHKLVDAWLKDDPLAHSNNVSQLPNFNDLSSGATSLVSGITDLVRLDPLEGLEPATRELRELRALSERLFFFAQRAPEMLQARIQLMSLQAAQSPESRTVLESVERVSRSADSLSATAEALPAKFSAERIAAIEQVSGELDRQREGLVNVLQTAREPLTDVLGETRTAAEATRALSESLTVTLEALGIFLDRFKKTDSAAQPPGTKPATPSRPFDVTEYGAAAERIGVAVQEIHATLDALDQRLPEIRRVVDEAAVRGEQTIDYAWRRMLELVLASLLGAALAVLGVRWISGRWKQAAVRS